MELSLPVFQVEIGMPDFILKGSFQPKGDILVYLNDLSYAYFRFDEVELLTLSSNYQVGGIKQPFMSLNRQKMTFVAILREEDATRIQVLQTRRPAVFYSEWCAIRGYVHVNPDTRDDDLLDRSRDFFPISDASIFPMTAVTNNPARKAPFVLVNRHGLVAYHALPPK